MDVNSPESAAGGFSVKSRLEELEQVRMTFARGEGGIAFLLPCDVWDDSEGSAGFAREESEASDRQGSLLL